VTSLPQTNEKRNAQIQPRPPLVHGLQDKANCLSDSKCFAPAMSGKGVYCVVEKRLKDKKS
jgi:hypothetical protein